MPTWRATASAVRRLSPVIMKAANPISFRRRAASAASSFATSASAIAPIAAPFDATSITVLPCAERCAARSATVPIATPRSSIIRAEPTSATSSATRAWTPIPEMERNSLTCSGLKPLRRAASTTACPSGCSEFCSTEAATRRTVSSVWPSVATTSVTPGSPLVSVPVLSKITLSIPPATSSASALRMRTPISAPRPVPTSSDVGVASPSAQGQAMMSTETAAMTAYVGFGPTRIHTTNVAAAIAITMGTKIPATRSASRWIGAFVACASCTSRMIWASTVSDPTRDARRRNAPLRFTVPPTTKSPGLLSTGMLSPVTMLSSTADSPSITSPSTGTLSPGRTDTRSPTTTSSTGTSVSPPSLTTRAASG